MSEDKKFENTLANGEQEPCLNESKTDLDRHSVVNKPHEKATASSRGASEDGRSDLESCGSSVGKDADDSQGGAADVSVDGAEEEGEVGPVDEGYSWVILVAAAFVIMGFPINNLSFGVFLDAFIDYYQLPQAVLGLMGAVRTCILFLTGAVTSPFIARYGCRPVAIFGVLLSTLGNALASMATSYGFLFFSFGILARSGSVLGRLVSGSLGNLSCTNRIAQFSISTGLLGVVVLIAIYDTSSAAFHLTIAGICGYFVGSYQALFATVAVDIVSLERLPHAMGWIQLARAMACMLVIPIGGWLYDIFGSYTTTFIFAGVTQSQDDRPENQDKTFEDGTAILGPMKGDQDKGSYRVRRSSSSPKSLCEMGCNWMYRKQRRWV
ncbi:hypothetical protein CAPTEDRAFT_215600 [Capitella teleta]|uniref:Major facilitator superfamily (MFS) profile domain-containing protein n=1 Tax=Capitella teleta TaxID=283909 RepID=R7V3W8_CAPTE|nr:hypothetical protein CAPTEDRAFT_215600 [Capitella teleta]|eukprot:ELU11046.1 hypothetical protein CAPTEDRAFT_215600 [Capitella teleta]